MTQTERDELRRLAEAAKEAPAGLLRQHTLMKINYVCGPVTILALLDERDALERRVAELEGQLNAAESCIRHHGDGCN